VVERPEEHGISCPVVTRDCAGIPHLKVSRYSLVHCGSLFSLLDVQRNRINKINDVTPFRKGESIGTSGAANIQNQCCRAAESDPGEWALQPFGLLTAFVVPENLAFERKTRSGHASILYRQTPAAVSVQPDLVAMWRVILWDRLFLVAGRPPTRPFGVYPANFCPLLTCGELAEFSGDFGEAI